MNDCYCSQRHHHEDTKHTKNLFVIKKLRALRAFVVKDS